MGADRCGTEPKKGAQLGVFDLRTGRERTLTRFPGGIADPVWSPDGNHIAFTVSVYPECGADVTCNRNIRQAVKKDRSKPK